MRFLYEYFQLQDVRLSCIIAGVEGGYRATFPALDLRKHV
jgi:hypothetical protein